MEKTKERVPSKKINLGRFFLNKWELWREPDFTVASEKKELKEAYKRRFGEKLTVEQKRRLGALTKPHMDFGLLTAIVLLVVIGSIMVISASSSMAIWSLNSPYAFARKQCIAVIAGIFGFTVCYRLGYKFFYRASTLIMIAAFIMCALVFVPGIGVSRNGASRWIRIPIVDQIVGEIQPSEIMKFALLVFFSANLSKDSEILCDSRRAWQEKAKILITYFMLLVLSVGVVFVQPHASASIIIALCAAALLVIGGMNKWVMLFGGIGSVLVAVPLILADEYRIERIKGLFNPGYQVRQALYAFGSGGFLGKGIGNGIQKYSYVPEPYNDFIMSIVGEELGFVGVALVMGLFLYVILRGMTLSANAKNNFSGFLAFGITFLIGVQFLFNMFVVSGIFPNTGITLPFISYGGSSMAIMGSMAGILLNISKDVLYNKL